MIKVLIINYNRIYLPLNMANWLADRDCEPIFIDNNSDYPPLLEFYNNTRYKVLRLKNNYGHHVVWEANIIDKLGIKENYIVTDPDLDLSEIPKDFIEVLEEGLRRYPGYDKCGFSLEINDFPVFSSDHPFRDALIAVKDWEVTLWQDPLDKWYFNAPIDTTFALYKTRRFTLNAIRTNRPYTARHIPWKYDNIKDLPEDEQYYCLTANNSFSGKSRIRGL